jgi:hypothetical protein
MFSSTLLWFNPDFERSAAAVAASTVLEAAGWLSFAGPSTTWESLVDEDRCRFVVSTAADDGKGSTTVTSMNTVALVMRTLWKVSRYIQEKQEDEEEEN